jgi:twitching motility protein PilI
MSKRISIKEFQATLSEKLEGADMTQPVSSVLGVLIGRDRWLVHMTDVSEVLQVPKITQVPLTRSWFLGMANVQGNLYGITDLAAYFGGTHTKVEQKTRILLVSPKFEVNSGLLVNRTLGIRNVSDFELIEDNNSTQLGVSGIYKDSQGQHWNELNLQDLVRDEEFLQVAA